MGLDQQRAKVAEFQRKHRVALLTLVFTDIVGSTKMKQRWGDSVAVELIHRHHDLVRRLLRQFPEAEEIETAGDSFLLVFAKPSDAVKFSLQFQAGLRSVMDKPGQRFNDRIGIHVGEVVIEEHSDQSKDLYGMQVDTCARVMSLAAGGQIVLTRAAFDNARQVLKHQDIEQVGALAWMNHGLYLLKGVDEPVEICEVAEAGHGPLRPPGDSEKARRYLCPENEPVPGWRPAIDQVVPGTRWMLVARLGEGGFGEVWLGRHETLKEQRVFKFCFRADRVRPLKREVTLFRLLKERIGNHPNIVGVQEVNFTEPPYYIVMDYSGGMDLRNWSEAQGGLEQVPLAERLEIVAQAADGLDAAHEAQVIHRDVKPSNILVNRQSATPLAAPDERGAIAAGEFSAGSGDRPRSAWQVKLTDFGIGQVVSAQALAGLTRMGFTQTLISPSSSSASGTFMYMAPELLAGQPASRQSDIYSLGVVLYQMIVGDLAKPVTADWARTVRDPLLREDLEKCFAGTPAERFDSGRELALRLRSLEKRRRIRTEEELAAAAREDRSYHRAMIRTGGVVAFIVMASFVLVLSQFYQFSMNAHRAYWQTEIFLLALLLGGVCGLWAGASFGRLWTGMIGMALGLIHGGVVGRYLNLPNATDAGFMAVAISFAGLTGFPLCVLLFRSGTHVRRMRSEGRPIHLREAVEAGRRRMVYMAVAAAFIFTLAVTLFYGEENWRGQRGWEATRRAIEAKGEHLDWHEFVPPAVPDGENFFKAPAMREWFQRDGARSRGIGVTNFPEMPRWLSSIPPSLDELKSWSKFVEKNPKAGPAPSGRSPADYILDWLKQYDGELMRMEQALDRPKARLDGNYETGMNQPAENFVHFRIAVQLLTTRAKAHLSVNQPEAAWQDLAVCRRLAERLTPRDLISAMMRTVMAGLYINTLGESAANGPWNDAQLETIQKELGRFELLSSFGDGLRGQRASAVQLLLFRDAGLRQWLEDEGDWDEYALLRLAPSGWLRQNSRAICEVFQMHLDAIDRANQRVSPGQTARAYATLRRTPRSYWIAWRAIPNFRKAIETSARYQNLAVEGIIACALERFRRAHGTYPSSLDVLPPQFLSKVPDDPMGHPFKYRALPKGGFLLYSVGWDENDDGGEEKNDWVWPYAPQGP